MLSANERTFTANEIMSVSIWQAGRLHTHIFSSPMPHPAMRVLRIADEDELLLAPCPSQQ